MMTAIGGCDTWIWVQLEGDHQLAYAAAANRGRIDTDGTAMCLRKSLMVEVDGVA